MNIQANHILHRLQRENDDLRVRILELEKELNQDSFAPTYNRRYFMESLNKACQESIEPFCVMFVDVDGLKMMNDRFGHAVGDEIILQVSHMLCAAIDENDVLARMGGDEFAILVEDLGDKNKVDIVKDILKKIHNIDFQIGTKKFSITVSVGVARGEKNSMPNDLLAQADRHMYYDKQQKSAGNDNNI